EVALEGRDTLRPAITGHSVASLGSVSLLGESAVDITPASGTPIPDYGYVPSGRSKGSLTDVSEQVASGVEELNALVKDSREGKGTVGKLMTDDQLYVELRQFTASANGVTDAIRQGRGTLGRLVNDPQTVNALDATLKNLDTMTRRINAREGHPGPLLNHKEL